MRTFDDDDIFNRKEYAEHLTQIILDSSNYTRNNALVIAIDSAWGTGKSTFIEKWTTKLNNEYKDKLNALSYNAWADDDYGEALIPIVKTIVKNFKFEAGTEYIQVELKKKTIEIAGHLGIAVVKGYINNKFGAEIVDEMSSYLKNATGEKNILEKDKLIESLKLKEESKIFDDFKDFDDIKKEFKKLLNKVSKSKKVVFFIDELDRCRPTYAIETLEVIKHFFDVENFIFVLSLDMEQLSHSIATIYGQNMDSMGYLRRFFDLHFKIPAPMTSEYVKFLADIYKTELQDEVGNKITDLFENFQLTLRDMNSVFVNIKLLLNTSLKGCSNIGMIEVYTYLLILKYKYPETYKIIMTKKYVFRADEKNNDGNIIKDFFFPTDIIKGFLSLCYNGGQFKKIEQFMSEENIETIKSCSRSGQVNVVARILLDSRLNLIIDPSDLINKPENLNININKYIERKLEIFSY